MLIYNHIREFIPPSWKFLYDPSAEGYSTLITLGAGGAFRIFRIYIGAENVRRRQIFMVALVISIKICNYCPITDIEEGFVSLHV